MAQQSRCSCGARKSRYATYCKACDAARRAERVASALAIVSTGVCPDCGAQLRRNLSLTGWWQCSQLGAVTHRADPSMPSCDFQVFTD